MLDQCGRRFGDTFSLEIAYEGVWVCVTDPDVKQVFTADPNVFHAGEANRILRPLVGENSVLLLDEKPHISSASCCCRPSTASA